MNRRLGCGLVMALLAMAGGGARADVSRAADTVAPLDAAQFAAALGAKPAQVSSFGQLSLPALGAQAAAAWGVVPVEGDPQPYLLLRSHCKPKAGAKPAAHGHCNAQTLRLPLGADVAALAWLDRRGAAFVLNLLQPGADPLAAQAPASAAKPALLLRVRQTLPDGLQRSTLVLAAVDGPAPVSLWREVDTAIARDGGGHRSHQLAFKPGADGWLDLELGQTTLPAAGATPQMPGPPLALRFAFDGQVYKRQR